MNKTKQYSKFIYVKGNRPIDPNHVKRLAASIHEKNLLHLNPVLVTSQMHVIDGQHRIEAAKLLKLEVFYEVSDEITKSDMSRLNRNKKNWTIHDYINYYCEEGYQVYIQFRDFINDNPNFKLSVLLKIVTPGEGHGYKEAVQNGSMIIPNINMNRAKKVIEVINRINNLPFEFKFIYDSRFPLAISKCLVTPKFNVDNLIEKIRANPRRFVKCSTKEEYLELIEEIYNYYLSENRINLTK
ncbi:MAG: ParB N-terminal domain-containing protein [Atribacterota bacterium]|nr:ParB N-terminal domain-containing protein [Atribacterota bacterium]